MNTYDRCHVDNATGFLTHHDRCTSVDEVKCRFQVHVDYHIPLLFAHTHHQTVASDTGIVYQYIDTSEVFVDFFYDLCSIFKVSCVRSITFGFYTHCFKFFCCIFCIFVNDKVSKCDVCTFGSKLQSDSLTNTAGSTGYNGCFSV